MSWDQPPALLHGWTKPGSEMMRWLLLLPAPSPKQVLGQLMTTSARCQIPNPTKLLGRLLWGDRTGAGHELAGQGRL